MNHNLYFSTFSDAVVACLICSGTSLLAGAVVFTVIGFMANDLGVPIGEVMASGEIRYFPFEYLIFSQTEYVSIKQLDEGPFPWDDES